jgi:hypothetical protein
MGAKAVLRFTKLKRGNLSGSTGHVARTLDAPNADPERKSQNQTVGKHNAHAAILDRVQAVTGGKHRKDAVLAYEFIMTAKADWFANLSKKQVNQWANQSLKWLRQTFGADNVVSATIHHDEAAPHIHAYVVPEIEGRLCAKAYTGTRKQCSQLQTDYAKAVKRFGLERGIKGSKATHIPPQRFHALVNTQTPPELPGRLASPTALEQYQQQLAMMLARHEAERERLQKANATLAKLTQAIGDQDWHRVTKALTQLDILETQLGQNLQVIDAQAENINQLETKLADAVGQLDQITDTLKGHGIHTPDQLANTLAAYEAYADQARRMDRGHDLDL